MKCLPSWAGSGGSWPRASHKNFFPRLRLTSLGPPVIFIVNSHGAVPAPLGRRARPAEGPLTTEDRSRREAPPAPRRGDAAGNCPKVEKSRRKLAESGEKWQKTSQPGRQADMEFCATYFGNKTCDCRPPGWTSDNLFFGGRGAAWAAKGHRQPKIAGHGMRGAGTVLPHRSTRTPREVSKSGKKPSKSGKNWQNPAATGRLYNMKTCVTAYTTMHYVQAGRRAGAEHRGGRGGEALARPDGTAYTGADLGAERPDWWNFANDARSTLRLPDNTGSILRPRAPLRVAAKQQVELRKLRLSRVQQVARPTPGRAGGRRP